MLKPLPVLKFSGSSVDGWEGTTISFPPGAVLAVAATSLDAEQPTQYPWVQEPASWDPAGGGKGAQKPDSSSFPV